MFGSLSDKEEQLVHASLLLGSISGSQRNKAILAIAEQLRNNKERILKANEKDLEKIKKNKSRYTVNGALVDRMIEGLKRLAKLDDPLGQTLKALEIGKGLELFCVSCSIGSIGVFLEDRPELIVEIAALCLKSGNAVMLNTTKVAKTTNDILFRTLKSASEDFGIPSGWVQIAEEKPDKVLGMKCLGLVIPRGSASFVKDIAEKSTIPVLGHSDSLTHIYVDESADVDMAVSICYDAKKEPGNANALDTLLVHEKIASSFLDKLKDILDSVNVKMVGDDRALKVLSIVHAKDKDWSTEYRDLMLSIKVVNDIDEAIEHVNKFGSHQTDVIVTGNKNWAKKFLKRIDSANVLWNCSPRLVSGSSYGLGFELCLSTAKTHARGPVGLEGLVIYKWKLLGSGDILTNYTGEEKKKEYTHKLLDKEFPLKEE